jgi:hypothetical protein
MTRKNWNGPLAIVVGIWARSKFVKELFYSLRSLGQSFGALSPRVEALTGSCAFQAQHIGQSAAAQTSSAFLAGRTDKSLEENLGFQMANQFTCGSIAARFNAGDGFLTLFFDCMSRPPRLLVALRHPTFIPQIVRLPVSRSTLDPRLSASLLNSKGAWISVARWMLRE